MSALLGEKFLDALPTNQPHDHDHGTEGLERTALMSAELLHLLRGAFQQDTS